MSATSMQRRLAEAQGSSPRVGEGAEGRVGPPPDPRRPGRGRGLDRDARPLARAGRDPGPRRGQARLRREAVLPQHPRGAADGRGGRPIGQAPPGRHPEPQHGRASRTRSSGSAAGRSARCWSPRPGTASAGGRSARRSRHQPPPELDFDLWVGPAPVVPYRSNLLPGIWRWWYDFGCGDIGNDGVHDIDVACWGLGVYAHPSRVACLGGKSFFDDDQQFPDTQYAVFEYPDAAGPGKAKQLIFEQRIWSPYVQEGYENGAAFYGTEGVLIIGHSVGWTLYGPGTRRSPSAPARPTWRHTTRTSSTACAASRSQPNADVMAGHRAADAGPPGQHRGTGRAGPPFRSAIRDDHGRPRGRGDGRPPLSRGTLGGPQRGSLIRSRKSGVI